MRFKRRRYMAAGLAAGVLIAKPCLGKELGVAGIGNGFDNIALPSINALVDTLVPADGFTPAASTLNVGHALLKQAEHEPLFEAWLREGLKWLDQGSQDSFIHLDEPTRIGLLERLANSAPGTQPRTFFEMVRLRVMTAYYADPRGRIGMAIDRPPQPVGYPDFAGRR